MSYEDIVAESDGFRAKIVIDETPTPPYFYACSPLLRYGQHYSERAEQVMEVGDYVVPDTIITAANHFERDVFERYLRIFHGATQVEFWHGDRAVAEWFVTFDTAHWREWAEVTDPTEFAKSNPGETLKLADMSEWQSYCMGEVYGIFIEKREARALVIDDLYAARTGAADDVTFDEVVKLASEALDDDDVEWEAVESVWGYYGDDSATVAARELLAGYTKN